MATTTRPEIPVRIGANSTFFPSTNATDRLVIFVHGFKGKSMSTWLSFPDFLDQYFDSPTTDVLFYGYPSKPLRMQNMANNLRSDIDAVWSNPSAASPILQSFLDNRNHSEWTQLTLVGHSLGAVVLRRALIDSLINGRSTSLHPWRKNCNFCLFAPAHTGSNLPELVSETFAFAKIPLVPIAKALYPVLHDLEIDSKALDALKNDYLGLPDNEKAIAKASAVVLAEKDRVVEPARFADDPISGQYDDKGHIDVCKPDANFTKPLETVAKILP